MRKRGNKYSARLENLIISVNWAEQLAIEKNCDFIIYLGDFFDKSDINAEELTALKEIKWSNISHYFLVGNHETNTNNLFYNSADIFDLANFSVISNIRTLHINDFTRLVFIPYILEDNRKPLNELIETFSYKTIIFSHNDINGIQLGKFISKNGFSIEEIKNNCDLFLNGHLHNGSKIDDGIINVGNLTGQNFSEDAFIYDHCAIVLDTDTLKCAIYENPYALNFYKIDFVENDSIDYINNTSLSMKHNCIVTIKCKEDDLEYLRKRFDPSYRDKLIPYNCNIIESKFIVQYNNKNNINNINETNNINIDHIQEFYTYIIDKYGSNDILLDELKEICK